MSKDFSFKQFVVAHDRCAMKVGTDGVLLGAWAHLNGAKHILDIGCGSGLIALMAAQRTPDATVWGIDIDAPSVEQAQENALASPFAGRVHIAWQDILTYSPLLSFDHILCNPPFYTEQTLPPEEARMRARHTAGLSLEALLERVSAIVAPKGLFSLILPTQTAHAFVTHALSCGWFVARECHVYTVAHKPPKRILLTLSRSNPCTAGKEELVLQGDDGKRSEAYSSLCSDFYL